MELTILCPYCGKESTIEEDMDVQNGIDTAFCDHCKCWFAIEWYSIIHTRSSKLTFDEDGTKTQYGSWISDDYQIEKK